MKIFFTTQEAAAFQPPFGQSEKLPKGGAADFLPSEKRRNKKRPPRISKIPDGRI
jgi:hypothetical protein